MPESHTTAETPMGPMASMWLCHDHALLVNQCLFIIRFVCHTPLLELHDTQYLTLCTISDCVQWNLDFPK